MCFCVYNCRCTCLIFYRFKSKTNVSADCLFSSCIRPNPCWIFVLLCYVFVIVVCCCLLLLLFLTGYSLDGLTSILAQQPGDCKHYNVVTFTFLWGIGFELCSPPLHGKHYAHWGQPSSPTACLSYHHKLSSQEQKDIFTRLIFNLGIY